MELQPAPNAAGAAEDRVTALARAKLAEFQRLKGIENPMTLEDAKASHHKLYKSLLAEAAAEVEGSKENVHPNTPMRPPPPASAPSPAPAPRRKPPAPRRPAQPPKRGGGRRRKRNDSDDDSDFAPDSDEEEDDEDDEEEDDDHEDEDDEDVPKAAPKPKVAPKPKAAPKSKAALPPTGGELWSDDDEPEAPPPLLCEAAKAGNVDELRRLLDAGAKIDETDGAGRTALMLVSV